MAGVVSQRHSTDAIPPGIGVREENIHVGSGLRVKSCMVNLSKSAAFCSGGNTHGTTPGMAAIANTGVFASITNPTSNGVPWIGRLPVPMTPTIAMQHAAQVTTVHLQFKLVGLDQFGNVIEEVTPVIEMSNLDTGAAGDSIFYITCSKVFSWIADISIRGDGIAGGAFGPTWAIGYTTIIDPGVPTSRGIEGAAAMDPFGTGVSSVQNFLGTHKNWGIGTPCRVSPYGFDPYAATPATSTLTSSGTRVADETVTIDGLAYTFKVALSAGTPRQVLIGGSEAATLQNLFDAINRSGTPGTQYTAITDAHPSVRASGVTATTVVVSARIPGSTGNLILIAETGANLAWGAPTTNLSGGVDSGLGQFPELMGGGIVLLRQSTTPTYLGSSALLRPFGTPGVLTGIALGQSAPPVTAGVGNLMNYAYAGWQGCPHKVGIKSSDGFATAPFSANGLTGNSQRANGIPLTAPAIAEDELLFTFMLRSHVGTQRDSVSARSYPR